MFKIIKYALILITLGGGSWIGYSKFTKQTVNAEGMKIEVRDNKCRLLSHDGKVLLDMEADGTTFTLSSASSAYGTHIQGNRVRVIDEDGQTVLCDMDYNGHVITVTNIHGMKISEVDVKLHMDKKTGVLTGIKLPQL